MDIVKPLEYYWFVFGQLDEDRDEVTGDVEDVLFIGVYHGPGLLEDMVKNKSVLISVHSFEDEAKKYGEKFAHSEDAARMFDRLVEAKHK